VVAREGCDEVVDREAHVCEGKGWEEGVEERERRRG
jgi:hypothetical protein